MRQTCHTRTPTTRQQGFTLMEVLIAVVVLSIGLLGLAGLQAAGLRNNQHSYFRSQSVLIASDIADRMRANLPAVLNGAYDQGAGAAAAAKAACTTTTGCTSADMASNDLAEWNQDIATRLPAGEAVVCLDSTPNDGTGTANAACDGAGTLYAIKIWWDDDRSGNTTLFATSFQP